MRCSILIFILLVISSENMYSASFDCTNSKTTIENMICSDELLSEVDEQLNHEYQDILNNLEMEEAEQIKYKQIELERKKWLIKRDQCRNIECVYEAYIELACEGNRIGSYRGAGECFDLKLNTLERYLNAIEEEYVKKILVQSENPEYLKSVVEDERIKWKQYRNSYCELVGQVTGGTDGWKSVWTVDCKVEETNKRIDWLKNGWH
ncbi:lysozyme inhibitor LprI family protein [Sulfurospirillum multivorans]|uniref:Lysozyme inhibitor LprI-like N-terminal domain-containing protein n=2 Tax=Sulfurospirillum multivorans TaxID=66821 RepID=A0AA86AJ80_SULMK|nr:lysozyme inhibitor LprI family protein [Sulfurospirillum multivorans]AHJ11536.1 hypothetical protein SMUL_0254 [Sulfurospirillum multivorans DSM 12446]QEH05037.1 hypothetical protein SMN_0248 [Sulfurospirillum multivorans]